MFLELIAAIAAGFVGGGTMLLLNMISGGRLPRWLMPVGAGLFMIAFAIRMEYTWFERSTTDFPEGVVITNTRESSALWRPWSYVWPIVNGFSAVNMDSLRSNEAVPEQRMADMVFFARWKAARTVPMVFDCAAGKASPLFDDVTYDDRGAVQSTAWAPLPNGDPTLETVCKEI